MTDYFHQLNDAYRCLLAKASPSESCHDELASCMFTCVCALTTDDQPRESLTFREYSKNLDVTDLACLVLTLVKKMCTTLTSKETPQETIHYFNNVSTVLFKDMDFMSKLVHLVGCEDRLLSHLAAQSISSYVLLELRCFNTLNLIWELKCMEVLHNPCCGIELDACLWSLSTVLKAVLKTTAEYNQGTLEKLLASFDTGLSALYSRLLPLERGGPGDSVSYLSCNTADWATTLSTFLELLEVLTAARLRLGTKSVCFTSPRLSFIQSQALLLVVASDVDYFVKRKALLLLKRTVLNKAGEDMALGETSSRNYANDHLTCDIHSLADGVLKAVGADWLKCVPVKSSVNSFGGAGQLSGGSIEDADHVMLRAVSLVVLKSVEYKVQSADIHGYLSSLLLFLRRHGVQLGEHPCCWVSLVFGVQDDDLMEAAKSLLLLQLLQRGSSGLDADAVCMGGRNPHCHFIFFLLSVSFDHSVLLDFLISTETCFLEYFVRYLKHLSNDWDSFRAICQKMDSSDRYEQTSKIYQNVYRQNSQKEGLQQSVSCGSVSTISHHGGSVSIFDTEPAQRLQPSQCLPSGSTINMVSPLRLVDYGSSDESETEQEVLEEGLDTGARETERRGNTACDNAEARGKWLSGSVGPLEYIHTGDDGDLSTLRSSQLMSLTEVTHKPQLGLRQWPLEPMKETQRVLPLCPAQVGLNNYSVTHRHNSVTLCRMLRCLTELRVVVSRLQSRGLFPYNPKSLLKLLAKIDHFS